MSEIESIWNQYYQDLKRFALSKLKQEDSVDDILQEVYIKAQINWGALQDITKVKFWLLTITRNTITDFFKKNNSIELQESDLKSDDFTIEQVSEEPHTEKDCLVGIIKNLPKKYREPLFLSDIKGIKQNDIAKQLHLPLSTVKSQIQRARKMIVQGYMDCCDYTLNEKGYLVGEIKEKEYCKVCNH
ncbi:MAG: sigma-70 family RNA polymerase sigma factor [Flavobacteriaceae bacterium]|nr:sigma-70 family RNA polymerase sigma factor [Flavobacteriaceae bacterium]